LRFQNTSTCKLPEALGHEAQEVGGRGGAENEHSLFTLLVSMCCWSDVILLTRCFIDCCYLSSYSSWDRLMYDQPMYCTIDDVNNNIICKSDNSPEAWWI